MSYTKNIVLLALLLSGCVQHPQHRPPDYKPNISLSNVVNFKKAVASLASNNTDKAEAMFKELTSDNPEISGPWANLGLIYFKKNKYSKSEVAINNALILNPRNPYALNLSAMLARKKGNIRLAHSLYTKAIQHKNDYALAHYNLALLYDIYFQDISAASRHYRKYLTLTNGKDKQTVDWLEQIQNTLKKS
jgi:Tfp pilus assembly protein PilF